MAGVFKKRMDFFYYHRHITLTLMETRVIQVKSTIVGILRRILKKISLIIRRLAKYGRRKASRSQLEPPKIGGLL